MKIRISKGVASGKISAPSSKSIAHRMLISAALCMGKSRIRGITPCEDVMATIDCLRGMGVEIDFENGIADVVGIDFSSSEPREILNCRESGSSLRFLIPLAWLSGNEIVFSGSERLTKRPLGIYEGVAREYGQEFKKEQGRIYVRGRLSPGEYRMRGDVSSQFITGMIFALSTLGKDSRIIITTPIESRSYIDLTLSSLEKMGVEARFEDDGSIFIRGGQRYSPIDYTVEGDYSGAAFMDALNCFGGRVEIDGLNDSGRQGDRVYKEHFSSLLREFSEIDLTDCPDLGPILFTVAAAKHGGRFTGTKRLRDKESDRIEAMKEELEKFGARLVAEDNSVVINPCPLHSPSEPLYGHNDHRIVMSLAVLCTVYGGEIEGAEAISKSYTGFFEDLKKLGIAIYEFE